MKRPRRVKLCFVFLLPVSIEKASFVTLVPVRLAKMLPEEIEICVLYSGHINRDRLLQYRIELYEYGRGRMRLPVLRWFSLGLSVYELARQAQVDVFMNVWAHYFLFPVIVGARLAGKKVIARIAGTPIGGSPEEVSFLRAIKRRFGLLLERTSLKMADHIYALSNSLKDIQIERGTEASRIEAISTGVDTNLFKPVEQRRNGERKVLFVGRLVENKGLQHLIRAFASVIQRTGGVQLIIVGDGNEMYTCKELLKELVLEDRVHCMGFVDHSDLVQIYNSSDLVVLHSQSEGLPNVVLEAQACGLPVLGTDVGEVPILLDRGRGSIVPFGDQEALAEEMLRLLSDDRLRKEMGAKGREYVLKEHSLSVVKEKYLAMFKRVVEED